jgi:PAS domain S-box-containing protein
LIGNPDITMAKILIVEDEIIVAWDIKENLEKSGHTVVNLALSGAEAIRSATTDKPDLVLMDIHLAGDMDGIAAGDEIYHRLKIPVVYLTAHADEFTLDRATQTDPFGYIVKPFQSQSLQTTIKIALQRHSIELSAQTAQISLGNALENIGSGVIVNDRQGIVTFINAVAQKLTGWGSADAVGMPVDRVFCLIWETDGTPIENPSLQAMRLNKAVKSPDRCWFVNKDRSAIPVSDTATPICTPNGEVIGGIIVFQDNTDRLTTEVELSERNENLETFQLKLISQLQAKTVEHQQAVACIELWDCLLTTVWMAPSETAFLSSAIQELGKIFNADYCWMAIHDRHESTARIICEHIDTERHIYPTSKVGKKIDIQLYQQFYDRLLEIESWIDPPSEIIPTVYRDLLTPTSQLAIWPIIIGLLGPVDRAKHQNNWIVGEIGIVMTGNLKWESFQSQAIIQTFNHAIQLFRKTYPQ